MLFAQNCPSRPHLFFSVNMFFSGAEFGLLRSGMGRGFLQTRIPREGWWGPDGVTREWGEVRSGGLGRELDLFVPQIWMYLLVGETSSRETGEWGRRESLGLTSLWPDLGLKVWKFNNFDLESVVM